ncbi:MAG: dihydroorotate dehydrogenase-like protein [Candidatus Omnitrophica bacterium]|nr:dihydroorotate dehydrogenase-like protein [Candidatus Omnitrophota bacterium]
MDLTTFYMGLKLKTPLVPSACQALTAEIDDIRHMEDAGAGAIVLYSLFEEQLRKDAEDLDIHTSSFENSFSEAASFFPEPERYLLGPQEYLEHIRKAKQAVSIPIIASINGSTRGGWTDFAKQMEEAGADAIELNIYNVQTDPQTSSEEIEKHYIQIIKDVKNTVQIPVAVKLSPYFTNLTNIASRLDAENINALVLFNRFYQPDINLDELDVRPDILLSNPLNLRLPLRWTAILYGRISADIAATSGIYKASDVIKLSMAGAKVAMLCSVILRYGIDTITRINEELRHWLEDNGYSGLCDLQGSMSQAKCENPSIYERVQYINSLHQYTPRWKRTRGI